MAIKAARSGRRTAAPAPRDANVIAVRVTPGERIKVATQGVGPVTAVEQSKLDGLIQDYARANSAKNKATSDEKRAKGLVHAELIAQGKDAHHALCDLDGNRIAFDAVIAAGTKDVIDVAALKEICSEEQFFAII